MVSMSKWLIASLLALNGGAAIALLNAHDKVYDPIVPGSLFVLGIVFALLNGWLIQLFSLGDVKAMQEAVGYWLSVVHDGERDEALEGEMQKTFAKGDRENNIAASAGWISLLLFLSGCAALAANLDRAPAGPSQSSAPTSPPSAPPEPASSRYPGRAPSPASG
jgi:hypothetical protein